MRAFSTRTSDDSSSTDSYGFAVFSDADKDKLNILKNIKGKSGIYRWVHKDSGKSYIGFCSILNDRFRRYFKHSYLSNSKRGASLICKALLKYGYIGFILEILEDCPSSIVLVREQFYIDKLNPEYNILKIAGSNLGYKHRKPLLNLWVLLPKLEMYQNKSLRLKERLC